MDVSPDLQNLMTRWKLTGLPVEPLTPIERRVTKLILRRLTTDRDIALQLGIKPKNAGQHVDNLRAKYLAKNRTELTALLIIELFVSLRGQLSDALPEPVREVSRHRAA